MATWFTAWLFLTHSFNFWPSQHTQHPFVQQKIHQQNNLHAEIYAMPLPMGQNISLQNCHCHLWVDLVVKLGFFTATWPLPSTSATHRSTREKCRNVCWEDGKPNISDRWWSANILWGRLYVVSGSDTFNWSWIGLFSEMGCTRRWFGRDKGEGGALAHGTDSSTWFANWAEIYWYLGGGNSEKNNVLYPDSLGIHDPIWLWHDSTSNQV